MLERERKVVIFYLGLQSGNASQPQNLTFAQLARIGATIAAHNIREVGNIGHFVAHFEFLGQRVRWYRCDELAPEQSANAE